MNDQDLLCVNDQDLLCVYQDLLKMNDQEIFHKIYYVRVIEIYCMHMIKIY